MNVKDFTVGQTVFVRADQGVRRGVVTKLGRTRVHIRHPRNKQGVMVERGYAMDSIILGFFTRTAGGRVTPKLLLFADGWFCPAADLPGATVMLPNLPRVPEPDEG